MEQSETSFIKSFAIIYTDVSYETNGGEMIVELISVGTELLLGDVLNTDAQFLSKVCASMGYDIFHISVVGDNRTRLIETLDQAVRRSDIVITSGGLGSTNDDISKECVIEYLGLEKEEDQETISNLNSWFGNKEALKNNEKVYSFPRGSTILRNGVGTSPGAWIPFTKYGSDKVIVILPGSPRELRDIVENELTPILKEHSGEVTESIEVKIGVLGEYNVYQKMKDLMENSKNPTFAPYVKEDGALIRITGKGTKEDVHKKLKEGLEKVKKRLDKYIINYDGKAKEETLLNILEKHNFTISIAESLTGGLISGRLVNAAGASKVLQEAYIVYSDSAKNKILGVDSKDLKEYSAVSDKVCRDMLIGLKKKTGCDVAIASTGYAGPGGDDDGHVFLGIMVGEDIRIFEKHWSLARNQIRRLSVNHAIDHLILELKARNYE